MARIIRRNLNTGHVMGAVRLAAVTSLAVFACGGLLLFYNYAHFNFNQNLPFFTSGFPSLEAKANWTSQDKWLVAVTGREADVASLCGLAGWRVVVVVDWTPSSRLPITCEFLTPAKIEDMDIGFMKKLPKDSYSRKHLGYLYAIKRGATIIYDTDEHISVDQLSGFYLTSNVTPGLMYAGSGTFNPFIHFGAIKPPDLPVVQPQSSSYRLHIQWNTPLIQIAVGDAYTSTNDPQTGDVTSAVELPFDPAAPPVLLPESVFSPFTSSALFHYRALWALLVPHSACSISSGVVRGYWAQRLLWELGGRLAFFPPTTQTLSIEHPKELENITGSDLDIDNLLKSLSNWACPISKTFFECVQILSGVMAEKGFVQPDFYNVTKVWLNDIINLGYIEPLRENSDLDLKTRWQKTVQRGDPTEFVPAHENASSGESDIRNKYSTQIKEFCSKVPKFNENTNKSVDLHPTPTYGDMLLIIVFNFDNFYSQNVKVLEMFYRQTFPNIIYCGSSARKFINGTKGYNRKFSYIEVPLDGGRFGYLCMSQAMTMNYKVSGYLLISDDMLVSTWQIAFMNKSKLWLWPGQQIDCDKGPEFSWWWWKEEEGKPALTAMLKSLRIETNHTRRNGALEPEIFLKNIKNGQLLDCIFGTADIYYVPKPFAKNVAFYLRRFGKLKTFQEIAVPMTLSGVANHSEITMIKGKYLWGDERDRGWRTFYSPDRDLFIHPVKISKENLVTELCHGYLSELLVRVAGNV